MIRLLQSGKFWLRCAVYGTLAAAAAALGLYFLLHHLLDGRRIQAWADEAVRGTGRTVRFDAHIGRSWLPRPTLTLRGVAVSKPNSRADAVHIGEMRIGLSWRSLWNGMEIEKWVLQNADAELTRRADGSWSLQDLWPPRGSSRSINRLIVENSRINLHLPEGSYRTEGFNANIGQSGEKGRAFKISGLTRRNGGLPSAWKGSGTAAPSDGGWQLPALHFEAELPFRQGTVRLAADADAVWQPQTHTLQAENISLRADSDYRQFHLSGRSPLILWENNRLSAAEISSVFTAGNDGGHWDGSFTLARVSLSPHVAAVGEFNLNGSHKNALRQTTFSLSGPLAWQKNTLLESGRLVLSSHQENIKAAPHPRLISRMEGRFAMSGNHNWQLDLKGLFDHQNAALSARYAAAAGKEPAKLTAELDAGKISLTPYWNDLQAKSSASFSTLLGHPLMPRVEAAVRVGGLTLPGLQIDDLQTLIRADNHRITLTNFSAGLYGGRTEGGISIANTNPPVYHLQQNAQGVHIRPLLQDLLGYHGISGNGNAVIDLTAEGSDHASLTRTLKGSLQLNISNGAWLGIDMVGFLSKLRNNIPSDNKISSGQIMQTPFRSFLLNSEISAGIGRHEYAELKSEAFHITGSGQTDLNTQTVSENVLIRNSANPEAKPIPIKISGPVSNPSVTLDYNRLTSGLATPEEKQRALAETLREQWQWLNTLPKTAAESISANKR
ncbi:MULTISPECIES: AsmA family protein [unclassified Neisseria]|uniref:AsmA family protein n=1 Tax=unclassified Neisseria TaxID=2623750 RepID=UPI001072B943|nr:MULTISPECIES: AsmA family protein [unclassified Neisseria]MBF0804208.1 AsmA family protein [Neisseria sp. 19428wB4_WF04]TFU43052.1 AsmA family protein [Neisseria sp. WF04]